MGRLKAPENEFTPSDLPPDHRLVMIGIPRGSGNFECVEPSGEQRLVEVGTKLKKMVLITRGDFAFIRIFPPSPELKSGGAPPNRKSKLGGEIVSMITAKEVKGWKKSGEWPQSFGDVPKSSKEEMEELPPRPEEEDEGYESDEEAV